MLIFLLRKRSVLLFKGYWQILYVGSLFFSDIGRSVTVLRTSGFWARANILLVFKILWVGGVILLILESLIYGSLYLEYLRQLYLLFLCCVELRIIFALGFRYPLGRWRRLVVCWLVFSFLMQFGFGILTFL